jgi:hypothetical protein
MRTRRAPKDQVRREYRHYLRYELSVRRHIIILRFGFVLAILLGLANLFLLVRFLW